MPEGKGGLDGHGVVGVALESLKIAVENPHPRSRDGGLVPLGEEDVALPQGRPPKGRATLVSGRLRSIAWHQHEASTVMAQASTSGRRDGASTSHDG